MLVVKKGDLFAEAEDNCILMHGCNAMGVMDSGVAKEVKARWPYAFRRYVNSRRELGTVSYHELQDGLVIANAITQRDYGYAGKQYVQYPAVGACCMAVASFAKGRRLPIHLPLIGGGYGGGNAATLLRIFEKAFEDVDATLWMPK